MEPLLKKKKVMRNLVPKISGLGDVIYHLARPVAAASDAVLKTDLKNCGSCAQKRADLNRRFPLP